VIGVAAEAAEAAEAADVEDTVIAPDWEELDVPAALDEDATVSGEVEEEASVEDAIVDVDKDVLGHHVVRLITSGLVPMLMMLLTRALVAAQLEVKLPKTFEVKGLLNFWFGFAELGRVVGVELALAFGAFRRKRVELRRVVGHVRGRRVRVRGRVDVRVAVGREADTLPRSHPRPAGPVLLVARGSSRSPVA